MSVDLWRWTNDDDFHEPWSEPTFAFLIARVDGNVVEYVQAADVSLIVTSEDGTVFHEAVDDVFAKHAAESAEKIAGLDKSSPTFYEDKVDIYREIRSRANRGDTYPRVPYRRMGRESVRVHGDAHPESEARQALRVPRA